MSSTNQLPNEIHNLSKQHWKPTLTVWQSHYQLQVTLDLSMATQALVHTFVLIHPAADDYFVIDCNIFVDINKNVTLVHVKHHSKIVLGNIISRSNMLNKKWFRTIKTTFGNQKATMKHQKLHAKLSECCSYNLNSQHCLLWLNEKYEIAIYKGENLLNRTQITKTCRHISKYQLANCKTIDWCQIHVIRYHYNIS